MSRARAFDPHRLRALRFPPITHAYGARDCILYALGIGYGDDPLDEGQLGFLLEERLSVAPTFASFMAYPGFWYRDLDTGLDASRVVHLAERIEILAPLPAEGRVTAEGGVITVEDLGTERGALVVSRRDINDVESGRTLARVTQTVLARGDGGFEATPAPRPPRAPSLIPARAPDHVVTRATSLRAALIFRLSGDLNPLHADPEMARAAGFPRPILHGLATYGVVGRALVETVAQGSPTRLVMMDARFTAPVFPGEAVRTEIWADGQETRFRALVDDRVVMDQGIALLTDR
ncbi:MaoC/PaaZ C-terminal domain-containing protein [Aquabacter cavernae]|uniref:MaoC/PaaZ C-terminal domain-containing protein n=1 Tax=Aquabacter cavernae TaxID=2496029 RepID=UPI000F8D1080|nr:MaoC/PaaZ C-terminal domain-containing protein [Aquabacter cavernae]